MKCVNHKELKQIAKTHYYKKIPLTVYGCFGVGKSEVIKETAKEIAKEKKKEFIEWNYIGDEEKRGLIKNSKNKFVFCDLRISQMDPSDIKGLPTFVDGFTEWKIPLMFKVFNKADGIIFFDEINTASPMMMNACLQIIHDRCVGDVALSKDVAIFGAGNRGTIDRSSTFDEPYPLRDRKSEVELNPPTVEDWCDDFAFEKQVDNRIISFLVWKPSRLLNVDFKSKDKPTTPRGWYQASELIKEVDNEEELDLLLSGRVGEAVAIELLTFIKLKEKINVEDIIRNPKKVKDIQEISLKYSLLSTISEYYRKHKKRETLEKIGEITTYLQAEFGVLLLRMTRAIDSNFFRSELPKTKIYSKIAKNFARYLL